MLMTSLVSFIGIFFIGLGGFLTLKGLNVLKTRKNTFSHHKKRWKGGIVAIVLGIGFLFPTLNQTLTSEPVLAPVTSSKKFTLPTPPDGIAQSKRKSLSVSKGVPSFTTPTPVAMSSPAPTPQLISSKPSTESNNPVVSPIIHLPKHVAEAIGQKIWMNETSGKAENLIVWNTGESFVSLGIGHFIWYPAGQEGPFKESFPDLLQFLQNRNVSLPAWLQPATDCPWNTREDFLNNLHSSEMQDLRALLTSTIPHQAQFLIHRLELALPMILAHLPTEKERTFVRDQFYRVAQTSTGVYALVDYVNFKGEGVSATERYHGQGWGLLQVLQQMHANPSNAVMEFADAAEVVLLRRVKNAPQERNESRWLPGWKNRICTYRQFQG